VTCCCGNKPFANNATTVTKPRKGTRCAICCCRRLAIIVYREPLPLPLCARCLARQLERLK
jgi:hypothetical protein